MTFWLNYSSALRKQSLEHAQKKKHPPYGVRNLQHLNEKGLITIRDFHHGLKNQLRPCQDHNFYNIVAYFKQIVTTKGLVQAAVICGRFLCSVRSRCCWVSRRDQFVMAEFVLIIEEIAFCCCFWCKMCLQFHFLQKFRNYFFENAALTWWRQCWIYFTFV